MLENNTFRLIMLVGSIIVVSTGITIAMQNYVEIKSLLNQFFSYRLQKY